MSTIELILMIAACALWVFTAVLNKLQSIVIKNYKAYFEHSVKFNDEVLKYCLLHIMEQSTEKEDYETASRCQKLLNQLNENRTPHNNI